MHYAGKLESIAKIDVIGHQNNWYTFSGIPTWFTALDLAGEAVDYGRVITSSLNLSIS